MSSVRINISDYIGMQSGLLTVIGLSERQPNEKRYYLDCKCDCGKIIRALPYQIKKQQIRSCGCLKVNAAKIARSHIKNHIENDRSKHPLYWVWYQMINRCENPNNKYYDRYGGRGIKVCNEWHNFNNFVKWSDSIGGRPKGYSIDHINNDGNYEPYNCRWATRLQQSTNKSSNIILEYNGESKTLLEWSLQTGIRWTTLWHRFKRGWNADEILNTPTKIDRTPFFEIPINQYDLSGNLICSYKESDSIPIGYIKRNILNCCDGKSKTYRNSIWKYADT